MTFRQQSPPHTLYINIYAVNRGRRRRIRRRARSAKERRVCTQWCTAMAFKYYRVYFFVLSFPSDRKGLTTANGIEPNQTRIRKRERVSVFSRATLILVASPDDYNVWARRRYECGLTARRPEFVIDGDDNDDDDDGGGDATVGHPHRSRHTRVSASLTRTTTDERHRRARA